MNERLLARRRLLQSLLAWFFAPVGALTGCGGTQSGQTESLQGKPLVQSYRYLGDPLQATKTDLHPTLVNVGLAPDRFEEGGLCHLFDGFTSSAHVEQFTELLASDFAISFWQKSSTKSRMQAVSVSGDAGESLVIEFNHQHAIEVYWNDTKSHVLAAGVSGEFTDGHWHHVAVQRIGDSLQVFVDGALLGEVVQNDTLQSTEVLYIGGFAADRWNGSLDDLRLHDRAFSADFVPHMVYRWDLVKPSNRADSMAGYYPFNGNAVNDTGHGIDGILNSVTLSKDRQSNPAAAYSFDGMNAYIALDGSFDAISNDFAIGLWVKTASTSSMVALSVSPGGCTLDLVLNSNSALAIVVDGNSRIAYGNPGALANDHWHFLLLQRAGGMLQLYVDGILNGSAADESIIFGPKSVIYFGKGSGAPGAASAAPWNGVLDDVQIYNRSFTSIEIKDLESLQFRPRDGAGALTFNGQMWLLGGWNPSNRHPTSSEVWCSADGFNWTLMTIAPWEGRHVAGWIVFADRMWVIGGDTNSGHYQNDVWSSADGINWEIVSPSVPWADRATHYCVAFDGRLWVMGGQQIGSSSGQVVAYNDVYSSTDGTTWFLETPRAAWSERGLILGSVVFKGRMWIIGGGTYDVRTYLNDVWSSSDGVHWETVIGHAPWLGRQYHNVVVFDNKIWVIAGSQDNAGGANDVWYTTDGASWTQLTDTPWAARHAASCFVHQNRLWIIGGASTRLYNDIWRMGYAP